MEERSLALMERFFHIREALFEQWRIAAWEYPHWHPEQPDGTTVTWEQLPKIAPSTGMHGHVLSTATVRIPDDPKLPFRKDKLLFIEYLANQLLDRVYDIYSTGLLIATHEIGHCRYLGLVRWNTTGPPVVYWIEFAHDATNLITLTSSFGSFDVLRDIQWTNRLGDVGRCVIVNELIRDYRSHVEKHGDRGNQEPWTKPAPASEPVWPYGVAFLVWIVLQVSIIVLLLQKLMAFECSHIGAPIFGAFLTGVGGFTLHFLKQHWWQAEYDRREKPRLEQLQYWDTLTNLLNGSPSPYYLRQRNVSTQGIQATPAYLDFVQRVQNEINNVRGLNEAA